MGGKSGIGLEPEISDRIKHSIRMLAVELVAGGFEAAVAAEVQRVKRR